MEKKITGLVLGSVESIPRRSADVRYFRCKSATQVVDVAQRNAPDFIAVPTDASMTPGPAVVASLRSSVPRIPIYVVQHRADPITAVQYIRAGATNVLTGSDPVPPAGSVSAGDGDPSHPVIESILTEYGPLQQALYSIADVAHSRYPILITGETGTGKDLLAQAIHTASRRTGDLVTENVAGLDDSLFSDTLFGHDAGAFTGAHRSRKGLVRRAQGGTLFLDEIGDISGRSQIKLLRLMEKGEFYPLGSVEPVSCDVRFIVATNRDLSGMIRTESFRPDLFYRLSYHTIHLPPLRERRTDIPLLASVFVKEAAEIVGKPVPRLSDDTVDYLLGQEFPGNIRELRSRIINAVVLCPGSVLLPRYFGDPHDVFHVEMPFVPGVSQSPGSGSVVFPEVLPEMQDLNQQLVEEALRRTEGNQSAAAELLGISASAVNKRLHRQDASSSVVT